MSSSSGSFIGLKGNLCTSSRPVGSTADASGRCTCASGRNISSDGASCVATCSAEQILDVLGTHCVSSCSTGQSSQDVTLSKWSLNLQHFYSTAVQNPSSLSPVVILSVPQNYTLSFVLTLTEYNISASGTSTISNNAFNSRSENAIYVDLERNIVLEY